MANTGIIVFEADNADFKNRKRAARACVSCQKRKKRCNHTFAGPPDQQAEKDSAVTAANQNLDAKRDALSKALATAQETSSELTKWNTFNMGNGTINSDSETLLLNAC